MKKHLFLALGALMLAGSAMAASTNTPTNSYTPTKTATPTLTPTATYTPTPLAGRDQRFTRQYFTPRDMCTSDSISTLATTPVANGVYLAQNQGMATVAFAVATPGAEPQIRLKWTAPQDYEQRPGGIKIWLTGVNSTAATTTAMVCNAYVMKKSGTTANYMNVQTMLGVTSVVQSLPNSYRLSQTTVTAKMFPLTMPVGITQVAAGDEVSFEVARTAGTGVLTIYTVEVSYNKKEHLNP